MTTRTDARWVAKVGGSLYDRPGLVPALAAWCATQGPGPGLLVAGGGPSADAVRELDRVHKLGEAEAHRLALLSLAVPTQMLTHALNLPAPVGRLDWWAAGHPVAMLDAAAFLDAWTCERGPVEASWRLTTDSVAAYAGLAAGCPVTLLKSIDIPEGTTWPEAAARGWVDGLLPELVTRGAMVRAVPFRP